MLGEALVILGVVLLIEVVSSLKELVFQRRLIEILDRFMSRSIGEYVAAQEMAKMSRDQLLDMLPTDEEAEQDERSLAEANAALGTQEQKPVAAA